jgi:hypothetical protein
MSKDKVNNYNRILEKFKVWQHDIYESNKSTWTDEDDEDILIIEELIKMNDLVKIIHTSINLEEKNNA